MSIFLLALWLGIRVEVDEGRINILTPPPYFFSSLLTILSLKQVTVIWSQYAPKAGFDVV